MQDGCVSVAADDFDIAVVTGAFNREKPGAYRPLLFVRRDPQSRPLRSRPRRYDAGATPT